MNPVESVTVEFPVGPRPEGVSLLHWRLHRERIARILGCLDHDLSGPASDRAVFATCRKCTGRFKVKIERDA